MPQKITINRTATPDLAPTALLPGELSVEMASIPPKLWVGVPTAIDATGMKLLNPPAAGGGLDQATADGLYVNVFGDVMNGALNITDATATSSTTTGALTVTGGVGIAGGLTTGAASSVGGTLTVTSAAGATLNLNKPVSSNSSQIRGQDNGSMRWSLELANIYNHFVVNRFSAAGAFVDAPFQISTFTGIADFTQTPTVLGVPIGGGAVDAYTKAESDAKFVELAGDQMTGQLTIAPATSHASLWLNSPAGYLSSIVGQRDGAIRWSMVIGDTAASSGPNTGTNFRLDSYDDAGVLIGAPLTIDRATGNTTLTGYLFLESADPLLYLNKSSGQNRLVGAFNGQNRWDIILGNGITEGGGNSGSNFAIGRYDDAGTQIDNALTIDRATGRAMFGGNIDVGNQTGTPPGYDNQQTGVSLGSSGSLHVSRSVQPVSTFNMNGDGMVAWWGHLGATCGNVTALFNTTQYNTTSDERLKEDLQPVDSGPIIDATEVYDFKWKDPVAGSPVVVTRPRSMGVIAQQAVTVFPQAITYDEESDYWGVDYSKYVPLLLQELKTLRARVAALEGTR
jgi:hypothetical protein